LESNDYIGSESAGQGIDGSKAAGRKESLDYYYKMMMQKKELKGQKPNLKLILNIASSDRKLSDLQFFLLVKPKIWGQAGVRTTDFRTTDCQVGRERIWRLAFYAIGKEID
jgi:hypothetical protein